MKNKTALDRMFINGKNNCFITMKDHKQNFLNNPKTRLLYPAKNELGRISKKNSRQNKSKSSEWNQSQSVEKH